MASKNPSCGGVPNSLSHLFLWANLTCCQMPDPTDPRNGKSLPMEECFAIQFFEKLDDPYYVDELITNPTLALGLLDYFANPSPNYREEFGVLGRAAVAKFLAREDTFEVFLNNSRDTPDLLFDMINENLGPVQKFHILRAEGVVSTLLFHKKIEELTQMMNDLEPKMLDTLLEDGNIVAHIQRYISAADRADANVGHRPHSSL